MPETQSTKSKPNERGFAIIPAGVIKNVLKHLSYPQLRVYVALLSFAPNIRPGQKRLAELTGYQQTSTVGAALDALDYMGLISRRRRYNGGYDYTVPKLTDPGNAINVAKRVEDFNASNQKQRRSIIRKWKDERAEFDLDPSAVEVDELNEGGRSPQTSEVIDVAPNEQGGSLGTEMGGRSAPRQRVQAQEENEKENNQTAGCSSRACAVNPSSTHPTAAAERASGPQPVSDTTTPRSTVSSTTSLVHPVQPSQPSTASTTIQNYLCHQKIPARDGVWCTKRFESVFSFVPPHWLPRHKLFTHQYDDHTVSTDRAFDLLSYHKLDPERAMKLTSSGYDRHQSNGPGWIQAKRWTPFRIKNAIWNTLLRYHQFAHDESKIKGIVFRMIEEDPVDLYNDSSRFDLDAGRDLELALMRHIFVERTEVRVKTVVNMIEKYTTSMAHLRPYFDYIMSYCLEQGSLNSPGQVKPDAGIGIRFKAFSDHIPNLLAYNPANNMDSNGYFRLPGQDYLGFTPQFERVPVEPGLIRAPALAPVDVERPQAAPPSYSGPDPQPVVEDDYESMDPVVAANLRRLEEMRRKHGLTS